MNYVFSEEAVKEVDNKLNSIANYLTPSGELHQRSSTDILDRVFANFTGF